ncbi:MAG TPA: holo-ACP synthase [Spirochaetota bacterium]|nr:holo-ACP synthase [Spirochaetota bacterium]
MIIGTGIDIVSIERIQTIVGSHGSRFAEKILSPAEQGLVPEKNPFEFIAGRFAAKEALMKAMGDTLLGFTEIEILNDSKGRPYYTSIEKVKRALSLEPAADLRLHLSISHERTYAVASAIIEVP